MKVSLFLISAIFVFASCAGQNELSEAARGRHFIYGKWETTYFPKAVITFNEDNFLKSEYVDDSGKVISTESFRFIIVDEKNVEIIWSEGEEHKTKIKAAAQNKDEMLLGCTAEISMVNAKRLIDFPDICKFRDFRRVKE